MAAEPIVVRSEFRERERDKLAVLYQNVHDYNARMAYIAHWLMPNKETFIASAIGMEADAAGLESNAGKHPDQVFWTQKKLKAMPSKDSVIVTDCKLLPCDDNKITSCQYRVPALIGTVFGKGIPIAVFAHNNYNAKGKGKVRWCYYTFSGATGAEVEQHIAATLGTWDWE